MTYAGLTHPVPGCLLGPWKRLLCPRKMHAFDEVWSSGAHYLYCDACGLCVPLAERPEERARGSKEGT